MSGDIKFGEHAVGSTSYQPVRPKMSSVCGNTCPKCGKAVYMAEEVQAAGKKWHKLCFKCGVCKKLLDSATMTEHEGDLYCKTCYGKNFTIGGYGYGGGAGTLSSTAQPKDKSPQPDATDNGVIDPHAARRVKAVSPSYTHNNTGWLEDGKQYQPVKREVGGTSLANKCSKCGKAVYMAEEVLAAGKKWHKLCFKCTGCRKLLDSSTMTEHEGDLYCKSCHGRKFGTSGYGYGIGAGTLASEKGVQKGNWMPSSTSTDGASNNGVTINTTNGSAKCFRCDKTVYAAEKIVGGGSEWHKSCFNCAACHKSLDSTTLCVNEKEIYCKGCYGKQFGPKGVGFGLGAGTLTT